MKNKKLFSSCLLLLFIFTVSNIGTLSDNDYGVSVGDKLTYLVTTNYPLTLPLDFQFENELTVKNEEIILITIENFNQRVYPPVNYIDLNYTIEDESQFSNFGFIFIIPLTWIDDAIINPQNNTLPYYMAEKTILNKTADKILFQRIEWNITSVSSYFIQFGILEFFQADCYLCSVERFVNITPNSGFPTDNFVNVSTKIELIDVSIGNIHSLSQLYEKSHTNVFGSDLKVIFFVIIIIGSKQRKKKKLI
ncbi:MAG: hypothetical protein ACXAC7_22495 [Candidatus Hodarchaeales archaeon]